MMCALHHICVGLPSRRAVRKVIFGILSCLTVMIVVDLASVQLNLATVSQQVGLTNQHSAMKVTNATVTNQHSAMKVTTTPDIYNEARDVPQATHWDAYLEAAGDVDNNVERDDVPASSSQVDNTLVPQRQDVKYPKQYHHDQVRKLSSNWTEAMAAEVRQVVAARGRRVSEMCRSLPLAGMLAPPLDRVYTNMLFVAKYRMVWCPIFKAASTTWVKNLLSLAGEKRVASGLHHRARQIYVQPRDPAAREDLLKNSLKMMIVRHPLERLLSAYRDKMLRVRRPNARFELLQRNIAQHYPDPKTSWNTTSSRNVTRPTFTQFLKKVKFDVKKAWNSKGMKPVNMHWRPYWLTCAPCHVTYDIISQVETLDQDQEYVIRKLGLQDQLYKLHSHSSNFDSYNRTSEATHHYYSQVPLSLLKEVVDYFKYDFDLFGYSPDPYYKMASQPTQGNTI